MSDRGNNDEKGGNNILYLSNFINENGEHVNMELDETGKKIKEEHSPNEAFSDSEESVTVETPGSSDSEDEFFIPSPLLYYRNKMYLASFGFAVAAAAAFAIFKNIAPIVLLLGCAYLFIKGFMVERDFRNGNIVEVGAVCIGVKPSAVRDRISLTFKSGEDEGASYYRFVLPAKKNTADDFIVDCPYVIYFDVSNPHALLAYVQV